MENQKGNDNNVTEHVVMLVGMRSDGSTNDVREDGVFVRQKIVHVRYRILRTLALFSAFIMLGATQSILGPSLVSMGVLLNEDTHTMTASLTALTLGYLIGAALCGALYDLLNRELLFLVGAIMIGISTVVAPSGDYLYLYIVALASLGFFSGGVDTAGQAYVVHLWHGHRCQWVMMLALHFLWASGSAIGPLMMRPFLGDIHSMQDEAFDLHRNGHRGRSHEQGGVVPFPPTNYSAANTTELRDRLGVVRYGFVLVGGTSLAPALLFSMAYFMLGPSLQLKEPLAADVRPAKSTTSRAARCDKMAAVLFLAGLFFLYNFINTNMSAVLATFAVKGLDWPNHAGASLTSLYFGANCIGKLLFVYPVLHLRPEVLNVVEMGTTLCGCALLFFCSWHAGVLWAAAAITGLGMSSINAACFFWADTQLTINGKMASAVMTSGSVGAMVGPALSGYLFDRYGRLAYVIVVLTGAILQLVVFLAADVIAKKCAERHHVTEKGRLPEEKFGLQTEPEMD